MACGIGMKILLSKLMDRPVVAGLFDCRDILVFCWEYYHIVALFDKVCRILESTV
jgi:hypothetical protein